MGPENPYLDFIRCVLSNTPPSGLSECFDWEGFFLFCEKQSVLGTVFDGIRRLQIEPEEKKDKMNWLGAYQLTLQRNTLLNRRAVEVSELFKRAGLRSCVLKGQGNALMYPNPYVRTPGDIDIWIDADRQTIRDFVKSRCPKAEDGSLHIKFPLFDDVEIEVHYKPRYLCIPRCDRRLQAYFNQNRDAQFCHEVELPDGVGRICVPTAEFNAVHQISHLYGHFFNEGVGLRQFIDYYYVLRHMPRETDYEKLFDSLGVLKFARGVMWVEQQVLGLEDSYLLVSPDKRSGGQLLREIMEGGNFGRYDQRYATRKKGYLARGITDVWRLVHFVPDYPEEALWRIWRKIPNQLWKVRNRINVKYNQQNNEENYHSN